MKAEDTVMKTASVAVWDFEKFKLDQAKISFKLGIREALIRVGKEAKRMDRTTYLVPDYKKYRQALKDEGVE